MLTVELPAEVEDRLAALASRTGKLPAEHALEAILDRLEGQEDAHVAQDRLDSLRAGYSDAVPLDDVMRRYGVAD